MSRTGSDPAVVFAALGDATRLALLRRLAAGETQSIARLSDGTGLTRQAITKHLTVLEDAGLVRRARAGRESHYGLEPDALGTARAYLDAVSAQWDGALERLRRFVEE